jgi:hypothetical protein
MNPDEIALMIELPGDGARAAIAELRAKLDETDARAVALAALVAMQGRLEEIRTARTKVE